VYYKVVGIILAIASGVLIGSSFVFKKKGLLASQANAGEGVSYLKSWLWWTGMISKRRFFLSLPKKSMVPLPGVYMNRD
jgi:hypothetical protein